LEFGRETNNEWLSREIRSCGEVTQVNSYCHQNNNVDWVCKTDSSCGYEVASRVFGSTTDGSVAIRDLAVLAKVADHLKARGAVVTDQCGLHVHMWVGDLDNSGMYRLLAYWLKMEQLLVDSMPQRRKENGYCRWPTQSQALDVLHEGNTSTFEQLRERVYRDRGALNIGHYANHRRVEFRCAEGTIDSKDIINWCVFLLHFVECCKSGTTPENLNLFNIAGALRFLKLGNDETLSSLGYSKASKEEVFYIPCPQLAEMRTWLLGRIKKHVTFSQMTKEYKKPYCEVVKERASKLIELVGV
jgi:hypothetical protein